MARPKAEKITAVTIEAQYLQAEKIAATTIEVQHLLLKTDVAKPTCTVMTRGQIFHVKGGVAVKDTVEVCCKDAADAYAWRTIY